MNAHAHSLDGGVSTDLRALIARFWLRRWWILGSVLVSAAVFATAAFTMTRIYRATTVVVSADANRNGLGALGATLAQFGGLAALAGMSVGGGDAQTEESLAVLRSREFTEKFINDRHLLTELFHRKWDANANRWRDPGEQPTPAQAFRLFDTRVRSVQLDRKTGLITLRIEWRDPTMAADWANDLVARLNAEMRARAIVKTNASIGYLQKELAATSTIETREAINRLMEAQINQRMLANVTEEFVLRVVDRALPPDPRDVARPKKAMLIGLGLVLGLAFGVVAVLAGDAFTDRREPRT